MRFSDFFLNGKCVYLKEVGHSEMYGIIDRVYEKDFDLEIIKPLNMKNCYINIKINNLENLVILSQHCLNTKLAS
jgi:hypothetical protein